MSRHCKICGKSLDGLPGQTKLCSDDCRREQHRHRAAWRKHPKRKATDKAVCGVCGQQFTMQTANQKFCSAGCRKESKRRLNAKHNAKRKNPATRPTTCLVCGSALPAVGNWKTTCSPACNRIKRRVQVATSQKRAYHGDAVYRRRVIDKRLAHYRNKIAKSRLSLGEQLAIIEKELNQ